MTNIATIDEEELISTFCTALNNNCPTAYDCDAIAMNSDSVGTGVHNVDVTLVGDVSSLDDAENTVTTIAFQNDFQNNLASTSMVSTFF